MSLPDLAAWQIANKPDHSRGRKLQSAYRALGMSVGPGMVSGESQVTRRGAAGGGGRRRVLAVGLGGAAVVIAGGVTGVELVSRGVLPGKALLDQVDGACSVPVPPLAYAPLGPWFSGAFYSRARRRAVGYTIAYPPGHRPGGELPLVVMLHGFGGNHMDALAGMSPAQAVALKVGGKRLPPMAMVTVDGGGGYWTPHPGDDPMAMVEGMDLSPPRKPKVSVPVGRRRTGKRCDVRSWRRGPRNRTRGPGHAVGGRTWALTTAALLLPTPPAQRLPGHAITPKQSEGKTELPRFRSRLECGLGTAKIGLGYAGRPRQSSGTPGLRLRVSLAPPKVPKSIMSARVCSPGPAAITPTEISRQMFIRLPAGKGSPLDATHW